MTHADIIARLTAATGPDRELDADIDAALRIGKPNMEPWAWNKFPVWRAAKQPGMCEVVHDNGRGGLIWDSLRFTASLDATVALIGRVLPGWHRSSGKISWSFDLDGNRTWNANLRYFRAEADAPTLPLALLLALFRALEAQEAASV